ncbi:MAG: D-2-hydroxyacid dehydrogenase [Fimbriimonas sp.]
MPKVWTNVALSKSEAEWLKAKIQPYELVQDLSAVNNLTEGKGDPAAQEADILFGQPAVLDIFQSSNLKWVHLTSAGYTRYDRTDVFSFFEKHSVTFTNSSSVYDVPCAEHVLSMMLAYNRKIVDSERADQWTYTQQRPIMRVLRGQKLLILGFGAIGTKLTELLQPFGMEIRGLKRKVTGKENAPCFSIESRIEHLGWADHIVNILPLSDSTQSLFGKNEFAAMKPSAVFYNIGRGDTVDQPALIEVLKSKSIAAAFLDVTSPEPLPQDHPLWQLDNCLVTPHVAGGLQYENQVLLNHFVTNFERFIKNQPLLDRR